MVDSVFWIWFQLLFGIGSRRADSLLAHFDDPLILYEQIRVNGPAALMVGPKELAGMQAAYERATEIRDRTRAKGARIVTPDHPEYPAALQNIFSKPAALYLKGTLTALEHAPAIAMVGTRTHTKYGERAAAELAKGLAANGVVVVSGLAKGIDTFCHRAALEAGGVTIGVLGCGLDIDYPRGSAPLKKAMCKHGAVVTEYPLGSPASGWHFPLRNRILSGMSSGVVVVEANRGSGSLITAGHAVEQNREVFAVPGDIFHRGSEGTLALIADGAKPVVCAEDILEELGFPVEARREIPLYHNPLGDAGDPAGQAGKPPAQAEEALSPNAAQVLRCLREGGEMNTDALAGRCDLAVAHLHIALTELEIGGLVHANPGRSYAPVS